MLTRQTFYLPKNLGEELRKLAYESRSKVSHLVGEAIRLFLAQNKKSARSKPTLFKYIGKFPELNSLDTLDFQKKQRASWHKK